MSAALFPDGSIHLSNYSYSITQPGERGCLQWDGAYVAPHHVEHFTAWYTDWREHDGLITFDFTGEIERALLDARPLESLKHLGDPRYYHKPY